MQVRGDFLKSNGGYGAPFPPPCPKAYVMCRQVIFIKQIGEFVAALIATFTANMIAMLAPMDLREDANFAFAEDAFERYC